MKWPTWRGRKGTDPVDDAPRIVAPSPTVMPRSLNGTAPAPARLSDVRVPDPSGRWLRTPPRALSAPGRSLLVELALEGAPMTATAARFPHVIDRIAVAWGQPDRLAEVFDELLVDRRGGRRGFPPDVLREIVGLHARLGLRPPR